MSEQLNSLNEVLARFDSSNEEIAEHNISGAVSELIRGKDETLVPVESIAEVMAFNFCEDYSNDETGWGTYYGPMTVFPNGDGTSTESPSIRKVTPEVLEYWSKRAMQAKNPVMKARYADLVWDFHKRVTGKAPNVRMAHIAIDSYVEIAENDCHKFVNNVVVKLERALSLALSLNDASFIKMVRDAIIAYEDRSGGNDSRVWNISYDLLSENKKVELEDAQVDKIIGGLEERLERITNSEQPISPGSDVWYAEEAAIRLASFYLKMDQRDEVKRVLKLYVEAVTKGIKEDIPLRALMWLKKVHSVLLDYGLGEEAQNVAIAIRDIGPNVASEMGKIEVPIEISEHEIKQYASEIVEGNLESAFSRIALRYVTKKEEVEEQLKKLAKDSPISFLITRQIQDEKGRPIASIGSLEDDLEGNIVHQISQNMSISSIFLREVMKALTEKFALTSEEFVEYLYLSPIFDVNQRQIIKTGIQAYLDDDHLVACHLLVPQIEDSVRNLVEKTGGSVLKRGRGGALQLKVLDELLRDQRIATVLGEDTALYFRILFTDQRGWNLRNTVCHGMMPFQAFGPVITDRIIHSLLCLALVREQEKDE